MLGVKEGMKYKTEHHATSGPRAGWIESDALGGPCGGEA